MAERSLTLGFLAIAAMATPSCGGGGSPRMGGPDAPTPSGGTQTRTIAGTTSLTPVGNSIVCTSDGHSFEAGEGRSR